MIYNAHASLNMHIARVYGEQEIVKCTKCDFQSRRKSYVERHFKRKHTQENQKACQVCGDVFKDLKTHLKRTGCGGEVEKIQYLCDLCSKTFWSKDTLTKHIKGIHKKIKDRKCLQCSYATYSTCNLRLHLSKMHGGPSMAKTICPHCVKETTNMVTMFNFTMLKRFKYNFSLFQKRT